MMRKKRSTFKNRGGKPFKPSPKEPREEIMDGENYPYDEDEPGA